eukprot:7215918-Prymnesium_polylepis.1
MDALCRLMASVWFDMNKEALNMSDEEMAEFVATIDAVPEYPLDSQEDMGSFGNMTTIMCLAGYFELNIICWNKKTLRNSGALQQCVEFAPTEDRPQACKERNMSSAEIVDFCAAKPQTIYIEWDGVNHYAALLGTSPVCIDSKITNSLLAVDPVMRQKRPAPAKAPKRPASGLPAGWTRLDDKIRTDAADCKVVTTKRTIDKHLSEALKGSFNAVLMLTVGGERAT